jgi:FG-GAP-like repeat
MNHLSLILALTLPFTATAEGTVAQFAAGFSEPVTRYGHDALGEGHEWGALRGSYLGTPYLHVLPDDLVFEDLKPTITDLNRDGQPEALVVEASLTKGARLALWDQTGRLAAGPFIGQRNRWLAVIGAADFDGDGVTEVAYVETPHIAPVLKLVHLEGDSFVTIAEAKGLTNHRFGAEVIESAIVNCGRSAVILTANADWTRVMATRLEDGALISADFGPYLGEDSFRNLPICN